MARAHGLNADMLPRNVDSTDIYRLMYATLFGRLPAAIVEDGTLAAEDR